jgi:uncharacterized protein (DUF2141 family)
MRPAALPLALLALGAAPGAAAELVVAVDGVRSEAGNIRAAVFDRAEAWLEADQARQRVVVAAPAPRTRLRFENLAPGRYAVALYHDENANAKHDRNFVGLPLEGFGFTRDPTVVLAAPSFAECIIEVPERGAEAVVRLKY